jgi:hypothetical protein
MNVTISSDQKVDVQMTMEFVDSSVYVTKFRMSGHGEFVHAVIGRVLTELVRVELMYDNLQLIFPILDDGQGNLQKIEIYGGRDPWSQLLRNAALTVN